MFPVPRTAGRPKSEQELEAREVLMQEEIRRHKESWIHATPVEEILRKLKVKLSQK
jgi:hypothetical protein